MNPWAILNHPSTMELGGTSQSSYEQLNEFSESHREESEISDFSRPYKTFIGFDSISNKHNCTELEVSLAHSHTTRQRGRSSNPYQQPSKFSESHREESEISDFGRPYKTFIGFDRISNKHNYTELEASPDHSRTMRQWCRPSNSYKRPSKFSETHREESAISEFGKPYKTSCAYGRISDRHNYIESRATPDRRHLTWQGERTLNSCNEAVTNVQSNMSKFIKLHNHAIQNTRA